MIAVMGATGSTGNTLLHTLTAQGVPCRALARTPQKLRGTITAVAPIEVAYADAANPHSLRAGLKGCDQLFLSMANGPDQVELETAVIDAATAVGVGHLVKLSAPAAEPDSPVAVSRGHAAIEAHLAATIPRVSILRPYAEIHRSPGRVPDSHARSRFSSAAAGDVGDVSDVRSGSILGSPPMRWHHHHRCFRPWCAAWRGRWRMRRQWWTSAEDVVGTSRYTRTSGYELNPPEKIDSTAAISDASGWSFVHAVPALWPDIRAAQSPL